MTRKYLIAVGIAVGAIVAACDGTNSNSLLDGTGAPDGRENAAGGGGGGGGGAGETGQNPAQGTTPAEGTGAAPPPGEVGSGTAPTNSVKGKEFYAKTVHPLFEAQCGACHKAGGLGTPAWIGADAAKTYELIYANGFAIADSRIVLKGVHHGGAAAALSADATAAFREWMAIEKADGGQKAQVNVLEKFGDCMSKTLFDQIGLQNLRTTRRQAGNNTNNVNPWNENANNCTGCDNAPCRTCHSADEGTGFVLALGNNLLPQNWTFEQTKRINPAYLQKYVATGPDGKPIASDGLKKKSDATRKDKAYTHPMYTVPNDMQNRINAFVEDAITKYNAGTCGQQPPQ